MTYQLYWADILNCASMCDDTDVCLIHEVCPVATKPSEAVKAAVHACRATSSVQEPPTWSGVCQEAEESKNLRHAAAAAGIDLDDTLMATSFELAIAKILRETSLSIGSYEHFLNVL